MTSMSRTVSLSFTVLLATAPATLVAAGARGAAPARVEYGEAFTVERDRTVSLPDFDMTFHLHGHKDVGEGESSPLIVHVVYKVNGRKRPFTVNLQPDSRASGKSWNWAKYRFTLLDYQYNAWMRLVVRRR